MSVKQKYSNALYILSTSTVFVVLFQIMSFLTERSELLEAILVVKPLIFT